MNEAEFRCVFDLLVSTTDEYSKLPPLIEERVVPQLREANGLLDVGAGPGFVTLPLSRHFEHIGIVEPDPVYCLEAVRKLLPGGKTVTAVNGPWESAHLGGQAYDLIVCAHVLYFVAPEEWEGFIQKMIAHLAPGGKLAIVLVAKEDETNDLIRHALDIREVGNHPFSAAAVERLQTLTYQTELLSTEANITADSAEKLLDVMALFPIMQYDSKSTKEQRLALIHQHFAVGGEYRMPYRIDSIVA